MCTFVAARTVGDDDVKSTPPLSRCAATVRINTMMSVAKSQSIVNAMNGSSNT